MRVLVTGGTGSFGRSFIRRILEDGSVRAVAYARHEVEMAAMNAEFGGSPAYRGFIGDVRDTDRLETAMRGVDVVVHAAALKRIEICEADPIEAVATNVGGTVNVIKAALRAGVRKAVLLSTDKAVAPVNLYGSTKLTAERLFLAANNISGGECLFSVCRYGNIWGSRGSVIHQWWKAERSDQSYITDPEATRYFLNIENAVNMVSENIENDPLTEGRITRFATPTSLSVENGIMIPRFMKAYRLGDLAEAFWGTSHQYLIANGLPPWEKKHETLGAGLSSELAPRMTVDELRKEIRELNL